MKEEITKYLAASALSTCSILTPKQSSIDFEQSYNVAYQNIKEYVIYVKCNDNLKHKPIPSMGVITNFHSAKEVMEIYNEYVNDLLDYIHDIRSTCHPPTRAILPIYK